MKDPYTIRKEDDNKYSILRGLEYATIRFRLPSTTKEPYTAENLSSEELVLAVLSLHFTPEVEEINEDLRIESDIDPHEDKIICIARAINYIFGDIIERKNAKISEKDRLIDGSKRTLSEIAYMVSGYIK